MIEPATTEDFREKILDDMCELGKMYLENKDVEQALYWLNLAASLDSDRANFELGKIYSYGDDLPKDMTKATEYFEKSGDYLYDNFNEIFCNFGEMYRYGKGVEKNIEKAIFWYELEVSCGEDYDLSCDAKFALGEIYRDGEGNIEPNGEKAVKYFMELAFERCEDYYEMINGVKFYEDRQNVPMFEEVQAYHFSIPANWGDDKARFALGCMYLYGQAVKPNIYKAAWWFAKIDEIDRFDWSAIFDLAEKYRTGDGVEKNIHVAIAWYEKIIEFAPTGYDRALFALAEIYFYGDGVDCNVDKAIDLYQQATDAGSLKAAHHLSELYFDGKVVKKNLSKALFEQNY